MIRVLQDRYDLNGRNRPVDVIKPELDLRRPAQSGLEWE
jgi:hypothetical protein